ncbi:TPA: aminotransferase class I/II-fold pyridoxal phosphate-dependent enzyme [Listeria monocytogenes]|nr:aminotransferase class I/II-fold pyridoxal phosphate-dependent enzyme [Listeria monocytogenes]
MLVFENDYTEGAHERILKALVDTNKEKLTGYGTDYYSQSAKEKIRKLCQNNEADIHFLVGGTQTNKIVIDALLQSYEGVVSAETGHINIHEAGAIELTGHKILTLPTHEGKIDAQELKDYLLTFYHDGNYEHMVFPGMVYISHPTEYGTLYTKNELSNLSAICRDYKIPLFLDGARLGYGLMADETDVNLVTISEFCDVFYIGGTKVGALCGEAIVFSNPKIVPAHFKTIIKQHGGLLAKGRLLGIQFDTLFSDNLYFDISKHAISMSNLIKKELQKKNYRFYLDSPTNQQFVILSNEQFAILSKDIRLGFWEKYDSNHTVVRISTSWGTLQEDVEKLITLL